jgi:hypothetical protein
VIAFAGFNSDRRIMFFVVFVCADHVLIYVYSFFHVVVSLSCVLIVAATLGPISTMVKRFYLLPLFSQPTGRAAQPVPFLRHGWLAAHITGIVRQ